MLASLAEIQANIIAMITNTAAYTIVAFAYIIFIIATWSMFTM
ncbi:MAG: hypothetical protein QNJ72_15715 [Pleurocapsa sp. MO_226.B13]|nr:hypothetical protein [Pleurocapsa sp. MO_226.B13]